MTGKKLFYNLFIFSSLFSFIACVKVKTPEAVAERDNWYESFSDSINFYENQTKDVEGQLKIMNERVANYLTDFEKVSNPREVAGYYIVKGWKSKLPFTSTAIYARIDENEKLELIATLAGSTFNRIAVGDVYSEVVPNDQALNYRHSTYNTVYFNGGKADSIAEYISLHKDAALKLEFLEGNKKTQFSIPENEKEMISKTWNVYSTQIAIRKLQKELALCARKIDTFRRLKDNHKAENEK